MASMKELMARAKATRDEAVPPVDASGSAKPGDAAVEAESFRVPRCTTCGAPREAKEGAAQGALAGACRFCGTP